MSEVDQVLCYLQNGKKCLNIFNVNFAWFEKARMHRKQQGYQEERRRSTVGSPWRCSRRSIDCHRQMRLVMISIRTMPSVIAVFNRDDRLTKSFPFLDGFRSRNQGTCYVWTFAIPSKMVPYNPGHGAPFKHRNFAGVCDLYFVVITRLMHSYWLIKRQSCHHIKTSRKISRLVSIWWQLWRFINQSWYSGIMKLYFFSICDLQYNAKDKKV